MIQIAIAAAALCAAVLLVFGLVAVVKRRQARSELEQHSIGPEALYALMKAQQKVLLFDIRQPLDLLARPEIIRGAVRIAPKDLFDDPSLIPRDEDSVVYCTCPGEETSRKVVSRAISLKFTRLKLLNGGLEAWKAKGYPVEPYDKSFHLDTVP